MANYCASTRTNYFHVKDPDGFKKYMEKRVIADEDSVSVWEEADANGGRVFGFGCYGSILGEIDKSDGDSYEDFSYDDFLQFALAVCCRGRCDYNHGGWR